MIFEVYTRTHVAARLQILELWFELTPNRQNVIGIDVDLATRPVGGGPVDEPPRMNTNRTTQPLSYTCQ